MMASKGCRCVTGKSFTTLQVSFLSMTDRLINFKRMGTYCEKSWNYLQKCSWSAKLKKIPFWQIY